MDKNTEERLLSAFREASNWGARADGADSTTESRVSMSPVPAEETLRGTQETRAMIFDPSQDSGPGESYHGASGSTTSASAGSSGGALESVASTVFGGALGLVPLVGSLFGLFGDNSKTQPVFQKYEMPSPIDFQAAVTPDGGLTNASYGQMGLPRVYDADEPAGATSPSSAGAISVGTNQAAQSAPANSATPQISVNVQAMDAQSFMSYSGEIAKAVRDAMLNLSSLNDVVTDL